MAFPVVLDICDKKTLLGKRIVTEEIGNVISVKIQEKRRLLKKVSSTYKDNIILVNNKSTGKSILNGKIKEYYNQDLNNALKVTDKISRIIAENHHMELPLSELVIVAENKLSYSLISHLLNIGRMFTIISENEDRKMTDEMYFKYGCVVRWKDSLDKLSEKEQFVVCADDAFLPRIQNSVTLNLTNIYDSRKNIVNLRDIAVFDEKLKDLISLWDGCPGLEMYSLSDILLDDGAEIQINRRADRIFLLDTDAF